MKILCATDFSASAAGAARVAARWASKCGARMYLVHAAHHPGAPTPSTSSASAAAPEELRRLRALLEAQALELRALGAQVEVELLDGLPDEAVLARAAALGTELLVIGPIGARSFGAFSLGSVAARLIKGSHTPVLVVREEASFAAWFTGTRPLRVMVGVDPSKPARAAIDWIAERRTLGPIDIVAGYVYQPGEERRQSSTAAHEAALAADVRERSAALGAPRVRVASGWGRVAEHLLDLAAEENTDLLVIGTHRRTGIDRMLHGSVSLGIVGHARRNVLTVPRSEAPNNAKVAPLNVRRVLVPVDMSDMSRRAIAWGCTLLPSGGTLQLLHVVAPFIATGTDFGTYVPLPPPSAAETERTEREISAKLRQFVPPDALTRGVEVHVEVVTAFSAPDAIARAAERLDSDVICLSTHGRSGLTRALLGSVAQGVVRHAHVPVLVVPPDHGQAHPH